MDVGVVGAGRVGTAVAVLLRRAGHRVLAASGRDRSRERVERFLAGVAFRSSTETASAAEVVIVAVPDDRIETVAREIGHGGGFRRGQAVVHLSGSAALAALEAARESGARTLSVHPLQTAPSVEDALERLPGSAVAVTALDEEGYVLGEALAIDIGGRPFRLADDRKPLYHAAAVFASNYVAAVAGIAERLFREAGLDDPVSLFGPLTEATAANVARLGPAGALTGPAARGDAGTVRANLEALRPLGAEVADAYVALGRAAAGLATAAGRISADDRARVEEVLRAWR
ncbi:MAG TPA: Rossmann-like and DUF2520 domain-containing protein [Actinomycetota bacterium]|nr:Rossmann-like and DUF2520 domain-containing protein [Actinomycetota bacterium]